MRSLVTGSRVHRCPNPLHEEQGRGKHECIYYAVLRVAWAVVQEAAAGSVAVVLVTRRPEVIAKAATGV